MSEGPSAVQGVQFREQDGKRSSQLVGKTVYSDAARGVDEALASRIENQGAWRKSYLGPVRELVEAGARSATNATRIAQDGLASAHSSLMFRRADTEVPVHAAFSTFPAERFETATIKGSGDRERQLVVPFEGRHLSGDALLQRLDRWVETGIIEPSCREAVASVVAEPDWLDLSGTRFVLMGAASEMGPLESLTRWGAEVIAIDLPRPELWARILKVAEQGSGVVHVPVPSPHDGDLGSLARLAGADLLTETPEIRTWVASFGGPMVVGNYVYADGSTFLRLATALDALTSSLQDDVSDVSIAYLATPTDVFAVPQEVVDASRARARSKIAVLPRAISKGAVFQPNYRSTVRSDDGATWGISDVLVPQQGPNYSLAKMMQRWRAIEAKRQGRLVSANVAPATKTRSVVKNKVLAAAFRGASAFGVEVFAPETSRALMSALLAHDLRNPTAAAQPSVELGHPFELFTQGAAHGGLWRIAYEPRSVLPLAVGFGIVRRG
ncbi:MAG: hypothetical protein ACLGIB_01310 [Actinomycetota bacterium]